MLEKIQADFNALLKLAKKHKPGGRKLRLALLGDSATQFLTKAIWSVAQLNNYQVDFLEADYNQINQLVYTKNSDLYDYQPDFIIIYHSILKQRDKFYGLPQKQKKEFFKIIKEDVLSLYRVTQEYSNAKIIYLNFPLLNDSVFGNYSLKVIESWNYQLNRLNMAISDLGIQESNLFLCDVNSLTNNIGIKQSIDYQLYVTSDMEFKPDVLPDIASQIVDVIQAVTGVFKKCLILDLDNTLWGGVIGDDGLNGIELGDLGIGKAFTSFQLWIKQLKERGFILAVCSKNTEEIAREPFQKHPDMILKEDDFAMFVANWNNKADNIRYIQKVLNIGFDSMIFLDDNPFERNLVRENIKDIIVPELPEDPAEYISYLSSLNLFETASYNSKDSNRTKQYQEEAQRKKVELSFSNQDDYLKNLGMKAKTEAFDEFNTPRVAQLTQRSNQFNFRTKRYTETDISKFAYSENYQTHTLYLSDKFGDYGLINLFILEDKGDTFFIDTWIMSCRVLKRGVENFILNEMCSMAKAQGKKYLEGEYLPTRKNIIVKDLYKELGFEIQSSKWVYDIEEHKTKPHFIEKMEVSITN